MPCLCEASDANSSSILQRLQVAPAFLFWQAELLQFEASVANSSPSRLLNVRANRVNVNLKHEAKLAVHLKTGYTFSSSPGPSEVDRNASSVRCFSWFPP
jgi:hypothetical protein